MEFDRTLQLSFSPKLGKKTGAIYNKCNIMKLEISDDLKTNMFEDITIGRKWPLWDEYIVREVGVQWGDYQEGWIEDQNLQDMEE